MTATGTGAVSRVRGRRGGGDSPVGSRRLTGEVPMGASAPDPKEWGIAGTPGNGPEVAGLRSAAMIMAYINGDWQYVCRVLGSSVSVCEHSHDTSYLFGFFAKKVNRYLRVNGNRNIHAPAKRSSDQATQGGFAHGGHARSVPKTCRQLFPAQPLVPSPPNGDVWRCLRRAFCLSDDARKARSRWSAGTGS